MKVSYAIAALLGTAAATVKVETTTSSSGSTTTTATSTSTTHSSFEEAFNIEWTHTGTVQPMGGIDMSQIAEAIAFLQQYQKYMSLRAGLQNEYTATGNTLMVKITEFQQTIKRYQQEVRDAENQWNKYKQRLNEAQRTKSQLKTKFEQRVREIRETMVRYETEQQGSLTEYRRVWFNGMSDHDIYMKVKPIALAFGIALDQWEETPGKCVDTNFFMEPDASLIIQDGDRFIGRTACHKRCKANPLCAAFSAEHNSLDTGECIMMRDGEGRWVGDGPRDPTWHCHVDIERDFDTSGSEAPDRQLLLSMLEEMELMLI